MEPLLAQTTFAYGTTQKIKYNRYDKKCLTPILSNYFFCKFCYYSFYSYNKIYV